MNVILTEDGQHSQYTNINSGRALVQDIGGFTTDFLAVNPRGEVDYSLARSVPIGVQYVLSDFEDSFRANNQEAVKDTPLLSGGSALLYKRLPPMLDREQKLSTRYEPI